MLARFAAASKSALHMQNVITCLLRRSYCRSQAVCTAWVACYTGTEIELSMQTLQECIYTIASLLIVLCSNKWTTRRVTLYAAISGRLDGIPSTPNINRYKHHTVIADTPGVHLHHRLPHMLTPEQLKAIHPSKWLRPYVAPQPADLQLSSSDWSEQHQLQRDGAASSRYACSVAFQSAAYSMA